MSTPAVCMAYLVNGALTLAAHQFLRNIRGPAQVRPPRENDGPCFRIELASGIVLRVTVEIESEGR